MKTMEGLRPQVHPALDHLQFVNQDKVGVKDTGYAALVSLTLGQGQWCFENYVSGLAFITIQPCTLSIQLGSTFAKHLPVTLLLWAA